MSNDSPNTISELEEQLVAYLDGELSPEESRRTEELLASDVEARTATQRLDRSWEMLERLDRQEADEEFARSTIEMVAAAAEEDVAEVRAEAPVRRRRRWLLAVGGLLAASLAGFLAVDGVAPDRNRQLIEDLPVLENLDAYLEIDDIEFLRELNRQQVFSDREAVEGGS